MDESLTDRLINTDVSAMDGAEMLAHLDAVEQQMRNLLSAELALLQENPDLVATRPQLQARLDYLRTLELEEVSGPGS
jgi:hypothetical protein